ncbi:MAG: 50S ribosomal protein L9 [Pseudomonadota bacterium]
MSQTQIILLERVENLGQMGDVVKVRPGFARNFLLPQGKALRATKDNIAQFEGQKKVLEANNAKRKTEAEAVAKKMGELHVVIVRQASEGGDLYGSVTSRDIADAVAAGGMKVERSQVVVNQAFKKIGLFQVPVALHPEVKLDITVNIARSEEEAKTQKSLGRALIADYREQPKPKAEEKPAAVETAVEAPVAAPAEDAA